MSRFELKMKKWKNEVVTYIHAPHFQIFLCICGKEERVAKWGGGGMLIKRCCKANKTCSIPSAFQTKRPTEKCAKFKIIDKTQYFSI